MSKEGEIFRERRGQEGKEGIDSGVMLCRSEMDESRFFKK